MNKLIQYIFSFFLLIGASYFLFNSIATNQDTKARNVLLENLKICSAKPLTGFYRDGFCQTGPDDEGTHVVCAILTNEFLNFSKDKGNDLITPSNDGRFPGLKEGDRWCLCASRWQEAYKVGVAPSVDHEASHEAFLKYISVDDLFLHNLEFHKK